jgi:hypothetical protein
LQVFDPDEPLAGAHLSMEQLGNLSMADIDAVASALASSTPVQQGKVCCVVGWSLQEFVIVA